MAMIVAVAVAVAGAGVAHRLLEEEEGDEAAEHRQPVERVGERVAVAVAVVLVLMVVVLVVVVVVIVLVVVVIVMVVVVVSVVVLMLVVGVIVVLVRVLLVVVIVAAAERLGQRVKIGVAVEPQGAQRAETIEAVGWQVRERVVCEVERAQRGTSTQPQRQRAQLVASDCKQLQSSQLANLVGQRSEAIARERQCSELAQRRERRRIQRLKLIVTKAQVGESCHVAQLHRKAFESISG